MKNQEESASMLEHEKRIAEFEQQTLADIVRIFSQKRELKQE